MPRANRHFVANHVWHITHRCHERAFHLKFARDRRCWIDWLFEARKRFDLCVLNYVVTSNHIHLLVHDRGHGEIARSMQLIAGRTAQEFNQRKQRRGAFWEDRYHATAIDSETYLARCMTYIDLNMVRAGIVRHPREWESGGYREIQTPPKRYAIVDAAAIMDLFRIKNLRELQETHAFWVAEALRNTRAEREPMWSESLAVGSQDFVKGVQTALGIKARYREVSDVSGTHVLREAAEAYTARIDEQSIHLSVD